MLCPVEAIVIFIFYGLFTSRNHHRYETLFAFIRSKKWEHIPKIYFLFIFLGENPHHFTTTHIVISQIQRDDDYSDSLVLFFFPLHNSIYDDAL